MSWVSVVRSALAGSPSPSSAQTRSLDLIELAVEVAQRDERRWPLGRCVDQASRTGTCTSSVSQAELVEVFSKHPLLRCTDIS